MTHYRWSRFVSPEFRGRNPFKLHPAANRTSIHPLLMSQLQAQANINQQQLMGMQNAANLGSMIGGGQGFLSGLFGGLGL